MGASEVQALQSLSRDAAATEIMANADGSIYVERQGGRLEKLPFAASEDDKIRFLEFLIGTKADLSPARPYADLTAQDGSRVHVLTPPLLGRGGLCITVRRRPERRPSLDDLIRLGALSPAASAFLRYAVENRRNVLVAGGTSSGKTTLMNALASFIPAQERILVLEDTPEITLPQPHALYLRTRMRDASGLADVTLRDLLKNSLRMRPDRILVGECRGPEAFDFLQAMSVGHDGALCTLHAGSCREALLRLETLALTAGLDIPLRAMRAIIAGALDLIVVAARPADGSRRVVQIAEVTGMELETISLSTLFEADPKTLRSGGFSLRPTGAVPRFYESLRRGGAEPPLEFFR